MGQKALERAKTLAVILAIEGVIALAVVAGAQQLYSGGVRTAQLQPCGPGAGGASDPSSYGTRSGTSTSGSEATPIGPTGVLPGSMPGTSGTGTSPGVTSPTPSSTPPGRTPNP